MKNLLSLLRPTQIAFAYYSFLFLPNANKDKRTPARPRESSELVSLLPVFGSSSCLAAGA